MKKAGVCILHSDSGTGWGSTNGVRGQGKMSSMSSIMRSYAVGSTIGGTGEPPSCAIGVTVVESLKQEGVKYEY